MLYLCFYIVPVLLVAISPNPLVQVIGISLILLPLLLATYRQRTHSFLWVISSSLTVSVLLFFKQKAEYIILVIVIDVLAFAIYEFNKIYLDMSGKLHETTDQLQSMEKYAVVGQLSAGLAHEIRNPLTSIRGFIQLLQNKHQDGMDKEYIEIIISELDRVNNLVKEFLLLAKPAEPKQDLLSIHQLIKETMIFMEGEAILHEIDIKSDVPEDLPLVSLDSEQMKQVLINIIHNAIEAICYKGKIKIKGVYSLDKILLIISDNGPGIPETLLTKIFHPFVTTKAEGTGLGLAVTKRIIESHGGTIQVESQVGLGTVFTIEIPVNS
ncbi:MAG: ATP-binding protein [Clostridia bacterium]|nr:ATP-binding protein [Clostridia bacterium]